VDEKQIIRLCKSERTEYYNALIQAYEGSLYRYCFHLSSNPHDAADLFQETWFKVFSKLKTYDEAYSFKNWLFTIASNEFKDRYRKKARRYTHEKRFSDSKTMQLQMESLKSYDVPADELLEKKEVNHRLKQEVNGLRWIYRSVVVLHYFEEQSVRDVSEVLKIPEGTVKSRLSKARQILRERMENHYG